MSITVRTAPRRMGAWTFLFSIVLVSSAITFLGFMVNRAASAPTPPPTVKPGAGRGNGRAATEVLGPGFVRMQRVRGVQGLSGVTRLCGSGRWRTLEWRLRANRGHSVVLASSVRSYRVLDVGLYSSPTGESGSIRLHRDVLRQYRFVGVSDAGGRGHRTPRIPLKVRVSRLLAEAPPAC